MSAPKKRANRARWRTRSNGGGHNGKQHDSSHGGERERCRNGSEKQAQEILDNGDEMDLKITISYAIHA